MKKEDILKQPWFRAVKAANRDLIREAGGIERVAVFLGVSPALVGNYNNWNLADLMPPPEMIALEQDLGRPVLSRAYAALSGGVVTDPDPGAVGGRCVMAEASGVMSEFSEFFGSYSRKVADGEIDEADKQALRPRVVLLRDQVNVLLNSLDHRPERDHAPRIVLTDVRAR